MVRCNHKYNTYTLQNIVWSKSQIDIESRLDLLSNSDIASTNDTPSTPLPAVSGAYSPIYQGTDTDKILGIGIID